MQTKNIEELGDVFFSFAFFALFCNIYFFENFVLQLTYRRFPLSLPKLARFALYTCTRSLKIVTSCYDFEPDRILELYSQ